MTEVELLDKTDIVQLRPDLQRLVARLVADGGGKRAEHGEDVNNQVDEAFCRLLQEFGSFFPGNGAALMLGRRRQCHDNVRRLVERPRKGRAMVPFTGFALSDDDIWYVHSWAQSPKGVIETTELRRLYFGIPTLLEEVLDWNKIWRVAQQQHTELVSEAQDEHGGEQ
jgi:hypothetical protein